MPQSGETAPLKNTITVRQDPEFLASRPWQLCCSLSPQDLGPFATELATEKEGVTLWTIAVILLVLWALAMVSSYTAGGLVHLLLVIAVIVVVFQFIGGRRSV